jgi:predicted Rossmann fold flavoprotein
MRKDVVIIGAGASGLVCAAECGKRGRSVLVLDHAERAGNKILISGGGRCNFTNRNISPDHYLSGNPHFCKSAIARFSPRNFLSLVEKYHIPYYEKEASQLFCVRNSRDILAMLEKECGLVHVEMLLKCRVTDIAQDNNFTITTTRGTFISDSLVIATGGLSYPTLGASEFGYDTARRFGLKVRQVKPALVAFVFAEQDRKVFQGLAGISIAAAVTCGSRRFRGNILFTHRGLSGPAALQASLYWLKNTLLTIDLLPETDILAVFLSRRKSKIEMHNLLAEYFPKRFAQAWCIMRKIVQPINQISDRELKSIAEALHAWEIVPRGTEGYKTAEVTAGGVDTNELSSKTMEAKSVPGLFFIGEVLDVTGLLGGYNLHWAWASGYVAGQKA